MNVPDRSVSPTRTDQRGNDRPLLLATRSAHKAREIREILEPFWSGSIVTPDEVGIAPRAEEDAIEVFETFRENALAKARYFRKLSGRPTLADDSGIVVPALGDRPGVRSKRFAGRDDLEGDELDRANNEALLEAMFSLDDERRAAYYVCAAVLVNGDGPPIVAIGTVAGRILREPIGTGGFGYDPLFLLPEAGRTFGEMDAAEKHRASHRGRAFRAIGARVAGSAKPR